MTAWTDFVKQYAKEKNLSYKEAMKQASPHYKNQKKIKLNIIEDDAVELPKIEPPSTQPRELIETIETTDEPIKQKKKKSRKVKLDIQESPLPSLVSKTEEELNKTSIPKLKEMLKELNFTKFAKFKKQDYVDKILELKNIPKGVWWRYKYNVLYSDLKTLYSYLDDNTMFNIEHIKRALLKENNKLEELKKSNLKGEQRRTKFTLIKDQIERFKEFIKEFDRLSNIDFEKEVEKLENEDADRNKRFADANKKHDPISRPAIEPPEPQTRELTETKDYKLQFAKKRKRLTKKQQRKKPPSYPPTIIETPLKKRKLIFPTPYRKVKLNIIEDDAIELPKIEPPPTQTRQLTETIETKNESIKSSPYKNIIEEWDTVNLPYVLFQEQPKIYDAIEKKILTLAKKKSSIVIPDLLFFIKPFLNELFVRYGSNKTALDIIQKGMADLVIKMGYDEDKVFKDNTEYLGKHFNKTHKKIIYDIFK